MEIYRKIDKAINISFAVLFAVMAIIALVALCMGYTQHVFTLVVSVTMTLLFIDEVKKQ